MSHQLRLQPGTHTPKTWRGGATDLLYLERVGAALWPHSSLLPGGAFDCLDFFPSCGLRSLLTCLPHRTLTLGRVTFPNSGPGNRPMDLQF